MPGTRPTASEQHQTRLSMKLAALVVGILIAVILVGCFNLYQKLRANEARRQVLDAEIRKEEQRTRDIEEFREYTTTREYIEEVARERLGLVYDGEVIFKEEDSK